METIARGIQGRRRKDMKIIQLAHRTVDELLEEIFAITSKQKIDTNDRRVLYALACAMKNRYENDVPKWIPVSERLPKKDGRYQVTRHDYVTNTEFIDILWYEKNTWWDRQATGDYAVTAWMPLPERYISPADAETAQGCLESAT